MTDAASKASAAKERGNAAFSAKDYPVAIEAFGEAIEADPTNHVLFSNRSAAHAAMGSFKDALLDANKCIGLKEDWPKGHARRGAAYFGLSNWPQAQAAYEKCLELDPASSNAQAELAKIKLKRDPEARRAAAAAQGGGFSSGGGFPGASSAPPPAGRVGSLLSLVILLCSVLYMLPLFPRYAMIAHKVALVNVLLLFLINLKNAFPLKLATLTDPAFKARQESQAFVLCGFMLVSPAVPFALMPFMAVALLNVCHAYKDIGAKLPGPLGTMIGPRMAFFDTPEGAFQVRSFSAVSELIVAVMTPMLVAVHGARAGILAFFYFQYVVRRHRTNELTQQAVTLLNQQVTGMLSHRFVPGPFMVLYGKIKMLVGKAAHYLVQ